MDRIERLERAVRWQRVGMIVLAALWLLGAKGDSVLELLVAKEIECPNVGHYDKQTKVFRTTMEASGDESAVSLNSPDGKRGIALSATDDETTISLRDRRSKLGGGRINSDADSAGLALRSPHGAQGTIGAETDSASLMLQSPDKKYIVLITAEDGDVGVTLYDGGADTKTKSPVRSSLSIDKDGSMLSLKSPNGKHEIVFNSDNDGATITIRSGDQMLFIDDEAVEALIDLISAEPKADKPAPKPKPKSPAKPKPTAKP